MGAKAVPNKNLERIKGTALIGPGPPWGVLVRFAYVKQRFLLIRLGRPRAFWGRSGGGLWVPWGSPVGPGRLWGCQGGGLLVPTEGQKGTGGDSSGTGHQKAGFAKSMVLL